MSFDVWIPLVTLSYVSYTHIYIYSSSIIYTYLLLYIIYISCYICIDNCIHFASRNSLQDCMLSRILHLVVHVIVLIRWHATYSCRRGPMLFDGLAWSFHSLVLLLLCFYATPSCWFTRMISGHALLASVSISQWWQLSMKLFFLSYSAQFLFVPTTYVRRGWMPNYPCELVYAL